MIYTQDSNNYEKLKRYLALKNDFLYDKTGLIYYDGELDQDLDNYTLATKEHTAQIIINRLKIFDLLSFEDVSYFDDSKYCIFCYIFKCDFCRYGNSSRKICSEKDSQYNKIKSKVTELMMSMDDPKIGPDYRPSIMGFLKIKRFFAGV